ncbi:MAG TPA: nuclease A inhibitor family protein [Pyrinomonadaceae bacterium]|nr:nuclease A inhibitor family protein [Pyrinomonadaceae bacterium]
MKTDEQILDELAKATEGLLFVSEADYPFETFRLDGSGEADPRERLRELGGESEDAPAEVESLENFFRAAASEPAWKGEEERALARRFQNLARVLADNLSDVRVYKVGRVSMSAYVAGRSPEGNWLGVSTRVVET